MATIHYGFSGKTSEPSWGSLAYITESVYEMDWAHIPHSHSLTEIFFVLDGRGIINVEGKEKEIKANDIVTINPYVKHTERSVGSVPLRYIVLGIEGIFFTSLKDNSREDFSAFNTNIDIFVSILRYLMKETSEKKRGYETVCNNLFSTVMIFLVRQEQFILKELTSEEIPSDCNLVKNFIDSYYKEDITLDFLADMVHLDKYYFSHKFKKTFGVPPMRYLIDVRLNASKHLLKKSDYNIEQIAYMCGFSSQNYFSQMFKKAFAVTASDYKNSEKDGTVSQ